MRNQPDKIYENYELLHVQAQDYLRSHHRSAKSIMKRMFDLKMLRETSERFGNHIIVNVSAWVQ